MPPRRLARAVSPCFSSMPSSPGSPGPTDAVLVQRAVEGDDAAVRELQSRYHRLVFSFLRKRGASEDDAEEVLATVWADCVQRKFKQWDAGEEGADSLRGWLVTIAVRTFLDRVRQRERQREESLPPDEVLDARLGGGGDEGVAGGADRKFFRSLLRACAEAGQRAAGPEAMAIFKLVYLDGCTQAEIARMWGWTGVRVSRFLASAKKPFVDAMLAEQRRREPDLRITWEDFVAIAAQEGIPLFPDKPD